MSSQYETSSGFTPADLTAPTVTFSPTDNATGVEISDNITISFNEAVRNIDDSVLTDSDCGIEGDVIAAGTVQFQCDKAA
jgi:hypothetical protein